LTNRKLRRSAHRNVAELEADITAWIAAWNDDPKPFVWAKSADEILENLARYLQLDRGKQLRDGDILLWDQAHRTALVARVDLEDVLVIDLSALLNGPPEVSMATCVELGHALGNQHWAAVVKGSRVYVSLTVGRAVMASVMKTHAFEGVRYAFVPGAEVIGCLAPHEARRLFGAAEGHRHGNAPASPGEASA
jgi:urease accessory protein UreE